MGCPFPRLYHEAADSVQEIVGISETYPCPLHRYYYTLFFTCARAMG